MLFGPEFTLLDGFLIVCLFGGFFKLIELIEYWCTPQKKRYIKDGKTYWIDRDTYQIERDPDEFWVMVREYLEEHKVDVLEDGKVVRKRDV